MQPLLGRNLIWIGEEETKHQEASGIKWHCKRDDSLEPLQAVCSESLNPEQPMRRTTCTATRGMCVCKMKQRDKEYYIVIYFVALVQHSV